MAGLGPVASVLAVFGSAFGVAPAVAVTDGTAWTVRQGNQGQLGSGERADRDSFGQAAGPVDVAQIGVVLPRSCFELQSPQRSTRHTRAWDTPYAAATTTASSPWSTKRWLAATVRPCWTFLRIWTDSTT